MAVTTQPKSNRKEAEKFVKELDPQIVLGRLLLQCICLVSHLCGAIKLNTEHDMVAPIGIKYLWSRLTTTSRKTEQHSPRS